MGACPSKSYDGRGAAGKGGERGGEYRVSRVKEGVPFPRFPRNVEGDVFATHATNTIKQEETNEEQDRVKRCSSVAPPLVQPTIVLL